MRPAEPNRRISGQTSLANTQINVLEQNSPVISTSPLNSARRFRAPNGSILTATGKEHLSSAETHGLTWTGNGRTTSYVVACDEPRVFAWNVNDRDQPSAQWRFEMERIPGGTGSTRAW